MPWRRGRPSPAPDQRVPDVVAVQSESFFDPRQRFPGVRPEVLTHFDRLAREGVSGKLDVPAFGANTVRSEFAFLSGVPEAQLGHRQFSPYRFVQPGFLDVTLASVFREAGYRTVCVHPYHGGFYRRNQVMPLLGFDEFVDITPFADARGDGPYVDDDALADWIIEQLGDSDRPLFVFAITMENHGPLHLETPRPGEADDYFLHGQASDDPDATIYLRHLVNADRMLGRLAAALKDGDRPGALCWFGDHPPILPQVYSRHGYPGRSTDYLVWRTEPALAAAAVRRPLHQLGATLIDAIGWQTDER
nr:LTA synthase family protein [Guyparkeria hydrothermalis]